ncbi:MAG: AraC family transcriptional regulator [Bacteroidetes bacterium]|nr:MAG: AraC family transcriptional regulator [Bacteroidota bacterium]TAE63086.1 MAG: AraC family transcriptional regulator [Bacteroidota bacterium]TAF92906.1 MAG: AraC family transcriptional regulator [Bacteroidota bacterium]
MLATPKPITFAPMQVKTDPQYWEGEKFFDSHFPLLQVKEQHMPGSNYYTIRQYVMDNKMPVPEFALLVYQVGADAQNNKLELRFCINGQPHCTQKNCSKCGVNQSPCQHLQNTMHLYSLHFSSHFLHQFVQNVKLQGKQEQVLAFQYPTSFQRGFDLSSKSKQLLHNLLEHDYEGAMENIFINARIHEILVISLNTVANYQEPEQFTCKFLADVAGRERIYNAKQILLENIGNPLTIKELAKKVAINECYLKKGFKELFGTTIFDFYQQQRMEHAKYLLYDKALSVTEVSVLLGYSSISHFSAAFKKHTGLKPCDLLK